MVIFYCLNNTKSIRPSNIVFTLIHVGIYFHFAPEKVDYYPILLVLYLLVSFRSQLRFSNIYSYFWILYTFEKEMMQIFAIHIAAAWWMRNNINSIHIIIEEESSIWKLSKHSVKFMTSKLVHTSSFPYKSCKFRILIF